MAGYDSNRKLWYVNNTITPAKLKQLIELEKVVISRNYLTVKVMVKKYVLNNPEEKDKFDPNFKKLFSYYENARVLELLKDAQPEPRVSTVNDFF